MACFHFFQFVFLGFCMIYPRVIETRVSIILGLMLINFVLWEGGFFLGMGLGGMSARA